jgi:hypothetical protein
LWRDIFGFLVTSRALLERTDGMRIFIFGRRQPGCEGCLIERPDAFLRDVAGPLRMLFAPPFSIFFFSSSFISLTFGLLISHASCLSSCDWRAGVRNGCLLRTILRWPRCVGTGSVSFCGRSRRCRRCLLAARLRNDGMLGFGSLLSWAKAGADRSNIAIANLYMISGTSNEKRQDASRT